MFRFTPATFPVPAAGDCQPQRRHQLNPNAPQYPPVYAPVPTRTNRNYSSYPNSNIPTGPAPATWAPPVEQLSPAEHDYLATDEFRMYGFKIAKCLETRSHDWTQCPYAHPGEKARRRDPRKVRYLAIACPEFRAQGRCSSGETCLFAHGVFEYWLHPARYRTRACKSGEYCKRGVCFFAHGPTQLRPETRYRFMYGGGASGAVREEVGMRPTEVDSGGASGAVRVEVGARPTEVVGEPPRGVVGRGVIGDRRVVEEERPRGLKLEFLENLSRFSAGIKDNGGSLMSWGSSNLMEYESEVPNVDWINELIE